MARKKKSSKILITITIVLFVLTIVAGACYFFILKNKETLTPMYLSSDNNTLIAYDEELNEVELIRGKEVQVSDKLKKINDV